MAYYQREQIYFISLHKKLSFPTFIHIYILCLPICFHQQKTEEDTTILKTCV
jgi:hypothetical protein